MVHEDIIQWLMLTMATKVYFCAIVKIMQSGGKLDWNSNLFIHWVDNFFTKPFLE
jgi:hypothetical protein